MNRTHSWCFNSCARPHLGIICRSRWMQRALCAGMHFAHHTTSWTDIVYYRATTSTTASTTPSQSNHHLKHGLQYVLERNFGEMEFDWEHRQVLVRVFGHTGTEFIHTVWPFDVLSGIDHPTERKPTCGRLRITDYERAYQSLARHNVSQPDDWICLNYRGVSSFGMKLFGVLSPVGVVIFLISLPFNLVLLVVWMMWRHRKRQYHVRTKLKQL